MLIRNTLLLILISCLSVKAQVPVNLSGLHKKNGVKSEVKNALLSISWPVEGSERGKIVLDLEKDKPLLKSIQLSRSGAFTEIGTDLDPSFLLTVGKRTLSNESGGWDVFFDRVPTRPYKSYLVNFDKRNASVSSAGSQTVIRIAEVNAASFKGSLEITLYNGSPLLNIAAVMATEIDSTAILYDAGLVSKKQVWNNISPELCRDHFG
ncbi:MAG: hypothetical protein WKF68_04570 [Daejeonella sp.]